MNLRSIIIGLSAISALGMVAAACSSSSTTTNTNNTTDGGGSGGGDSGGGGGGDDGGGGGGGGSCATKLTDGMYTETVKATPGNDVDASSPVIMATCKDSTDTITIDSTKDAGNGGVPSGCTQMTSSDGCTQTITCMQDMNGYTTNITIEIKIDSTTQFTTTTTSKTVADDGGAVQTDCTTVSTAVKM